MSETVLEWDIGEILEDGEEVTFFLLSDVFDVQCVKLLQL